jgi:predicted nucleic acid-binding protein
MNMEWNKFLGKTLNVTMHENYGIVMDPKSNSPIYEIVFKSGSLIGVYDDGLLLEARREKEEVKIFVPYKSIKCVEIFNF